MAVNVTKKPDDFSIVEVRMIQNMLKEKSIQFIASMLDRPYKDVVQQIKRMVATQQIKMFQPKVFDRKISRSEREKEWAARQLQDKTIRIRNVDESKLINVRIDSKTIVKVKPGTDIEAVKKKYGKK